MRADIQVVENDVAIKWTSECQKAFDKIKDI